MTYELKESRANISAKGFKYFKGITLKEDTRKEEVLLITDDREEALGDLIGYQASFYKTSDKEPYCQVIEYYVEKAETNGEIIAFADLEEEF